MLIYIPTDITILDGNSLYAFGKASPASLSFFRASVSLARDESSTRVSLSKKKRYSYRKLLLAYSIPRLRPPETPKLLVLLIKWTLEKALEIASAEPSVEPLSTTTTS